MVDPPEIPKNVARHRWLLVVARNDAEKVYTLAIIRQFKNLPWHNVILGNNVFLHRVHEGSLDSVEHDDAYGEQHCGESGTVAEG